MFGIGTQELVIVLVITVILFGNRLPSVAQSMGKSIGEFKKGLQDFENQIKSSDTLAQDLRMILIVTTALALIIAVAVAMKW
jgi:sec-independent protein translocase protein TatA